MSSTQFAVLSSIGCNTISNLSFSHSYDRASYPHMDTSLLYIREESKAIVKTVSCVFFS